MVTILDQVYTGKFTPDVAFRFHRPQEARERITDRMGMDAILTQQQPLARTLSRPGFVLVVDDEPFFAEVAMEILLHAGYHAAFALDAAGALRQLEGHPEIDLLFTDVVLPGMDGFALASEAMRRRPGLRVLYSSVHIALGRSLTAEGDGDERILEKPYRPEQLLATVRQILEE